MKKIGIITYHKFYNYGSMLQAFALQRYLEDNGADAEIINYTIKDNKENKGDILVSRLRRMFNPIKRETMFFKLKNPAIIQSHKERFDDFYSKYIKLGNKEYATEKELKEDLPNYDIYMVGSDQMWNPYIKIRSNAFYLSFVPDDKIKVSYAPSIGGKIISNIYQKEMKQYLERFDYLSCRDKIGSEILSKLLNREVKTVVDPTLLLNRDYWSKLLKPKENIEERYIVCYFLGNKRENIEWAIKKEKKLGIKVYFIYSLANDIIKGLNYLFDVGPQEFLWLIKNAQYVCTDSFHGTIFSINFGKQFFSFTKRKDGEGSDNNRIYQVLEEFGITDRLIKNEKNLNLVDNNIDYDKVDKILEEKINESKKYLEYIIN